jgi:hypothetical protein
VVPLRALLDTGTTATIILREFVGKCRAHTIIKKRTKWKTLGGTFTINYESLLDFKFPEISISKVVTWQAQVDDNNLSKEAAYDMIMGMDLMTSIGITVDCEKICIRWGGTEIPLKTRNKSDHLARLDGGRYQQTFETDAGHGHGPYEPAAPKNTIHLEGAH